jgi:NTE family protein
VPLIVWIVLITASIGGCAHYPVNPKLQKFDLAPVTMGTAFHSPNRSDELFLVLAFSGGGTRAAALAYGVLEGLAQVEIPPPSYPSSSEHQVNNESHRLVHEVDAVTGVSGGSITAAYFALHGDGIFKSFKKEFLYRNVTWGLIGRLLNPYNMLRVGSAYFSKSDLEAEYLDDHLFHGATYKDLQPGKAPFLLIQATDITDGNYFTFTPLNFGLICSDLSAFPLARATAASSSVPGPFGAITLRNYAGQCGYREEAWFTKALATQDYTSRSYRIATQLQAYRSWNDKPFIHLIDGAVSDNLGLRGLLDFFVVTGDASAALRTRGLDQVKRKSSSRLGTGACWRRIRD